MAEIVTGLVTAVRTGVVTVVSAVKVSFVSCASFVSAAGAGNGHKGVEGGYCALGFSDAGGGGGELAWHALVIKLIFYLFLEQSRDGSSLGGCND